ncbi:MAG: fibrobacter succinogenes major paralogous domain-containing protein [Fibromonadaceae bacterium]|nr:fibrobacter succinogenes major paralogous domain-containing protein [Fibromonadaceae bacterium]
MADIGRQLNANYIAQGRIGRFGGNYTIEVKLYNSASGLQVAIFTGNSKDVFGLLAVLDKKAPDMFKEIAPKEQPQPPPPVAPQPTPAVAPAPTVVAAPVVVPAPIVTAAPAANTIKDSRDGKTYKTVKIGTQTWMAENLNYNASGSKCYKNETQNCDKYGRLYDWNTAMKTCPSGWHLPSDAGWNVLMKLVKPSCFDNNGCPDTGTKLKAKSGWNNYKGNSGNGTDGYGFSALPGDCGDPGGDFDLVGSIGGWWSSSELNGGHAYSRGMYCYPEGAYYSNYVKSGLFSVRCLQD